MKYKSSSGDDIPERDVMNLLSVYLFTIESYTSEFLVCHFRFITCTRGRILYRL